MPNVKTGMFYSPDPSPLDPENQDLGLAVIYATSTKTGRWQYSKQGGQFV